MKRTLIVILEGIGTAQPLFKWAILENGKEKERGYNSACGFINIQDFAYYMKCKKGDFDYVIDF